VGERQTKQERFPSGLCQHYAGQVQHQQAQPTASFATLHELVEFVFLTLSCVRPNTSSIPRKLSEETPVAPALMGFKEILPTIRVRFPLFKAHMGMNFARQKSRTSYEIKIYFTSCLSSCILQLITYLL